MVRPGGGFRGRHGRGPKWSDNGRRIPINPSNSDQPEPDHVFELLVEYLAQPVNSLTFKVDGRTYASLPGGATDWQYVETNLLSGSHTLLWTYTTGSSLPNGIQTADSAWVGDVTLTPTNITPIAPVLNIERTGPNSVVLFSVAPDDWHLQQNFNLATTNWVGVTNPVNVIDGSNEVTITPLTSNQFFRLKFPSSRRRATIDQLMVRRCAPCMLPAIIGQLHLSHDSWNIFANSVSKTARGRDLNEKLSMCCEFAIRLIGCRRLLSKPTGVPSHAK